MTDCSLDFGSYLDSEFVCVFFPSAAVVIGVAVLRYLRGVSHSTLRESSFRL